MQVTVNVDLTHPLAGPVLAALSAVVSGRSETAPIVFPPFNATETPAAAPVAEPAPTPKRTPKAKAVEAPVMEAPAPVAETSAAAPAPAADDAASLYAMMGGALPEAPATAAETVPEGDLEQEFRNLADDKGGLWLRAVIQYFRVPMISAMTRDQRHHAMQNFAALTPAEIAKVAANG